MARLEPKTFARKLRRDMSDAERKLWRRLRRHGLGAHFRRQHPLGPYVLDFVCLDAMLVIEVDGGQHSDSAYDERRTAALEERGFRVLRFWNNEVLEQIEEVCSLIQEALDGGTKPSPPP